MSKRKKIFLIAYIVLLSIIVTFMINKIFAAVNSGSQLSGNNKYAGYEAKEIGTPKEEWSVTGKYTIESDVEDKAHGELDAENNGFMHEDLLNDDDVFCFDGNKHLFSRWTLSTQKIARTNYIGYTGPNGEMGYHDSNDYVIDTLLPNDTIYPDYWTSTKISLNGKSYFCSQVVNLSVLQVDRYDTSYAESYIFAQKNNEDYQASYTRDGTEYNYTARQFAIWELKREEYGETNSYIGNDKPIAKKLYEEATEFQSFREEFKLPKLNSNSSDYEFKYNVNGDYFIAGPIIIDYPTLELDSGLVVGKITSSKLYGTNSDGAKNIEVDFEIADKNGNEIDFPTKGGQFTFYIKVSNSTVKSQKIKEITNYKVNFDYLDARGYGYTVTDPSKQGIEYYQWDQEESHEDCWIYNSASDIEYVDCDDGYYDYDYCSDLECDRLHTIHHDVSYQLQRRSSPSNYAEVQPIFALGEAELFWRQYELEITFKPDGGLPTYIDLGGRVWVDNPMDNGKVIDESDGIFNNNEYGRENVLVELFFFDGTPVKVTPNKVVEDKRNVNLVNPANGAKVAYNNTTVGYAMYTDADGEYMFYGLPVDQKYFVRFTYDGQTYEKVLYLAGGSETDYLSNPNDAKYDNNSKVKDETDRAGFNNRFKEITYANIRTRETGRASGTSTPLSYIFKTYKENEASYIKSKIITTDNRRDAEYGEPTEKIEKQTGKVIDPFKLQARTPESLKYPFEKNGEILIWSAKDNEPLRYLKHINLGLKIRPRADFQLSTQLKAGATTIKDKEKVVIYPQSATKANLDKDMDFTRQEDEYIKQEISAADYNWAARFREIYGENGQEITGYVVDENKLHVYVLYRIAIKNQCEDANDYGVINEIIDYYDNRLERVQYNDLAISTRLFREAGLKVPIDAGESWIEGTNTEVKWEDLSDTVRNQNNRNITYNMMKSTTPITIDKGNSETAIYLILKVKDNGAVLYQGGDENDQNDGMQNIAEIGSYSVYNNGVNVGKIDKDSAPGNATPGDRKTYEDDTDASPMFKLVINWTPKEIEGTVWDDSTDYGSVDGTLESAERRFSGVEGVTVKLVEHIIQEDGSVKEVERPGLEIRNNKIYVDSEQSVITGKYGKYSFYVEGGNYSLKFVYGDQEMLRTNKTHNAQDYQALNYSDYKALSSGEVNGYNQSDKLKAFATNEDLVKGVNNFLVVGQEGENSDLDWWNTNWNIGAIFGPTGIGSQSKKENEGVISTSNSVSSVRDKAEIRADIIENTQNLTYYNASKLDELNGTGGVSLNTARFLSGENTSEPRHTYTSDGNYTYMEAVSDIITIASNDLITEPNVINLGLKQRPTASRKLEKRVDRIILTASDGTVLVDTDDNTKQSGLAKIDDIQQTFINLEPGLMDGALLDIYYTLTVTNDSGANDCLQNYVYVRGNVRDEKEELQNNDHEVMENLGFFLGGYGLTTPLPIKAEIFDYVNINLEYRADDNKYEKGEIWDRVYEESGNTGNSVNRIEDGWLSESAGDGIERSVKKVSKVLQTNTDKVVSKYKGDRVSGDATDGLLAGESVQIPIHLGITLSEDTSKMNLMDYDFSNCAELVKITTLAGRRDYETIPGDYVPYDTSEANKKQQDAFLTGTTAITPPLGEGRFYYVITIVSASIILVGIVLIKKKVLKK